MAQVHLIGDVGGTNARFAFARSDAPGIEALQTLRAADFGTLLDAIRYYLDSNGVSSPDAICIAAAGPVVDGSVHFTNNSWFLTNEDLKKNFATERALIVNDFAAIAYSLPFLQKKDLMQVGPAGLATFDLPEMTFAVVGPGTGCGAEGLRRHGDEYLLIESEAPRCSFAPETERQFEVLSVLREKFERVTSEHLVSGPGIENVYQALAHIEGHRVKPLSSAEIFAAHIASSNLIASEAVNLFYEVLGQVAGDFALTIGAYDGVFIAGSIAQPCPALLTGSRFRESFERKGDYSRLVKPIPTSLITHVQPGLLGAAYCARTLA